MVKTKLALAALALGTSSTASASILVLSSGGPTAQRHYPPGTRLPDATVFGLRAGDTVSVLWGGSTRSFRGPGAFSVVAPATPYALVDGRQVRIQTGVVRAPLPEQGVDPTDLWDLDTRQAATLCLREGATPLLWRARGGAEQRLTVRPAAGPSATVSWAAGASRLTWPAAVPVRDGALYALVRGTRSVRVALRVVPAAAQRDLDSLSEALIARGCTGQLATLIATRAAPVAQDAASGQR